MDETRDPSDQGNQKAKSSASTTPILSPDSEEALEKALQAGGPKALQAFFTAIRSSTTFGPDPETAKVMAQIEMHEEECRLKGYQSSLENREKQSQRDHEYRKKKLNHQSSMTGMVLLVSVAGVGAGLYLYVSGNHEVGGPVLAAALTLLSSMAGKLLSSDKD